MNYNQTLSRSTISRRAHDLAKKLQVDLRKQNVSTSHETGGATCAKRWVFTNYGPNGYGSNAVTSGTSGYRTLREAYQALAYLAQERGLD